MSFEIRRAARWLGVVVASMALVACASPAERAGQAADFLLAHPGSLLSPPVFARLPEDASPEQIQQDRERRAKAAEDRGDRLDAFAELQDVGPDPAAKAITARLDRGSLEGRRFLITVLHQLGKWWIRSARRPLIEAFDSLDPAVQAEVLGLLWRFDATDAELFKLARSALLSEHEAVQGAARQALARGFPKNRERLRSDIQGLIEREPAPVDSKLQREVVLVHAIAAVGGDMDPDAEAYALARGALLGDDESLREPAALLLRSLQEQPQRLLIFKDALATGDKSYAWTLAGLILGLRAGEREPVLNSLLAALPGGGDTEDRAARLARPILDLLLGTGRSDRTFGPQLQAALDRRRATLNGDPAAMSALEAIVQRRDQALAKPLN